MRDHGVAAFEAGDDGEARGVVEEARGHDHACVGGFVAGDRVGALLGGEVEDIDLVSCEWDFR